MIRNPKNRYGHVVEDDLTQECVNCHTSLDERIFDTDCEVVLRHDLDDLLEATRHLLASAVIVGESVFLRDLVGTHDNAPPILTIAPENFST
jgi:hypothetical protein